MTDKQQITLDEIEAEILRELGSPEAFGYLPPEAEPPASSASGITSASTARAARKPYRINDFDSPRDKEMAVFTHAKKLSEYIFVITEKSPKRYRWSIVSRLQNCSVEVVEYLYRANFEREKEPRIEYQKRAAVTLKLLDFYSETARKKHAISVRQMGIIARQLCETEKLLNGWVRSSKSK